MKPLALTTPTPTPVLIVQTEGFENWPEGTSTVTTRFAEADGETTLTIEIEHGTQEARDAVIASGFGDGYEASYVQLDELVRTRLADA
jgi:uncharacterized protein YndB with AHSA1/START domain